jgi:hypothetical protein
LYEPNIKSNAIALLIPVNVIRKLFVVKIPLILNTVVDWMPGLIKACIHGCIETMNNPKQYKFSGKLVIKHISLPIMQK